VSLFNATVEAYLAGATVKMATLLKLDFVSETTRVWNGVGTLRTGGADWLGLGTLSGISGLEQAAGGKAPSATLTLSGIDPATAPRLRTQFEEEAKGRKATAYLQFFRGEADVPTDDPVAIRTGTMQSATVSADGSGTRVIEVRAESLFALRRRPKYGLYTDSDRQLRFPGDKGLEFIPSLMNKVATWPTF
jgi:hypothetical protein